jgi:putative hydroxymethylpyrimidine transport system substrate-binding protein
LRTTSAPPPSAPRRLRVRRSTASAFALLLATGSLLVLSACGSKQDKISPSGSKPFTVVLDFFPNADHAALYSGIAHGDFSAAGLDVQPQTPANPSEPLKLLAAGKADMAISYEPELLLARDEGFKLVSIGALVQRPLTSIIALPQGHVRKVADLAHKTVGTAGIPYQAAELKTAVQAAGAEPASVKEVNVGFNLVQAMLSNKVAATLTSLTLAGSAASGTTRRSSCSRCTSTRW